MGCFLGAASNAPKRRFVVTNYKTRRHVTLKLNRILLAAYIVGVFFVTSTVAQEASPPDQSPPQAAQSTGDNPLAEQLPGAKQTAVSPHTGGTDPNLPQPDSKAEALSAGQQLSSQDSEHVVQKQYTTPDVPRKSKEYTGYNGKYFSARLGLVLVADYTAFSQDADSISQVGIQQDQWDDRALRFLLFGGIGPQSYRVGYFVSYEWNGFDAPQNKKPSWDFTDLSFAFPVGTLGALTVGKTKEHFGYEIDGDATFLPQDERILNPFFTARDVGVILTNAVLTKRMTYSAGWFNDWWAHGRPFDGTSNHYTARVTGLISISEDGSRYLHLGVDARYVGATNGFIRLQGRPESNVASNYIDTGKIAASNEKEFGLEALWTRGRYSILAEYNLAQVNATQVANPSFYGLYITGSWVVTGEHRPYDRNVGYARRIIPQRHFGAIELVGRYSRLDLDDKSVHGGILDKGYFGVNWFLNRRWKVGEGIGIASLDRAGLHGLTSIYLTRIQFVY